MKVRADEIKNALSKRHRQDFFLTEVKTGPSTMAQTLRLDAMAIKISWTSPCFSGYEVKVSRNDFLRDSKYIQYKKYCHRLYIACPKDMIKPDEIPDDIGLVYYNPETNSLFTKRLAKLNDIELSANLLYYILLSRTNNDRHPFFSSDREYIEAFMQNKADKIELGIRFKSKLISDLKKAEEEAKDCKNKLEEYEDKAIERDQIIKVLVDKGIIRSWEYNIPVALEKGLKDKYPEPLMRAIESLNNDMNNLNGMLKKVGVE